MGLSEHILGTAGHFEKVQKNWQGFSEIASFYRFSLELWKSQISYNDGILFHKRANVGMHPDKSAYYLFPK